MDYGPSLSATCRSRQRWLELRLQGDRRPPRRGAGGSVSAGEPGCVYDHDTLRLAAAWTGQGFIDWNGINFNGRHQVHPRIVGKVHVANPLTAPAGQIPTDQSFADLRVRGGTADPTAPCRAAGRITRGFIATATG